ncbi:magnesium transporter CorA family protein [Lachnoclostridium sp. An181]|uniref:magnesium transporter CorA family protein n=1 Tax=Lachnoclostridium sp. An181 TaxID=1965575 RepID=UPI000B37F65B|nr:CorA family divalent cation transporter [Lachnoclostridium sp. An181]OUP51033.1 hypothetical protein B5F18_02425 [Lachnoclostridium sp. An181]
MRFRFGSNLARIGDDNPETGSEIIVEIISVEEYRECFEKQIRRKDLTTSIEQVQYCKADLLSNSIIGTFVIPDKKNLLGKKKWFGYFIEDNKILFIDENGIVEEILSHIVEVPKRRKAAVAHFLFEVMEYLIQEDVIFLQKYEEKLAKFEEKMLDGELTDVDRKILHIRRELLTMDAYYQQLVAVSDVLEEDSGHLFDKEESRLFGIYSSRVTRLQEHTHTLKEYTMQLREMYQSQIDVRQNQIMKFLTVVTTIFMPLTLIAGWYGMNFVNMPELKSPYGYGIVIVVSIAVICMEVWYFKIKKWF